MRLLHNIGTHRHSNYTPRELIQKCNDPLSFDGVYTNVFENRDVLKGKDVTLFVMGDYIGGNNDFDIKAHPRENLIPETYCTLEQILQLQNELNAVIGWHTKTHRDLTKLSIKEIEWELERPEWCAPVLAYPFGRFNEKVLTIVHNMGYLCAYSVDQGDDTEFQRRRRYL